MTGDIKKYLLISAGTLFAGIGIVGIFIPILPTTPFLLLSAACYLRSSRRLYGWLLNNRVFGYYIRAYVEKRGLPWRVKLITIVILWTSIGLSAWLATHSIIVRVVLLLVAVGVTVHIILIKKRTAY